MVISIEEVARDILKRAFTNRISKMNTQDLLNQTQQETSPSANQMDCEMAESEIDSRMPPTPTLPILLTPPTPPLQGQSIIELGSCIFQTL